MTLPADADRLLATLRTGAWLDAQVFPPLAYAVPGLIPEGSVLLVGPPKIGKSWLVLTVALAAAAGGNALSITIPKRPVLYLALEDGDRRLQDRCRKLLRGEAIPREFQYLLRPEQGRVIETITAWLDREHDIPPLVILDTLGRVMPPALPGETSYQRDYRIGTTLKRIADDHAGMCLLTNHHDRKAAADDWVDSVSGTHGLAGAADTIIVVTRARQRPADGSRSPAATFPRASTR
jgi:AAA domain